MNVRPAAAAKRRREALDRPPAESAQASLHSTVRAREPVERSAFGMGEGQDERVLFVPLERDQVRNRWIVALRISGDVFRLPGHLGYDSGASPIRSKAVETSATNSSPSPRRRSSYQSAALRSSARTSGCSSTRTPLLELLQDLRPHGLPTNSLNATFGNFPGTPFQLGCPGGSDFIV